MNIKFIVATAFCLVSSAALARSPKQISTETGNCEVFSVLGHDKECTKIVSATFSDGFVDFQAVSDDGEDSVALAFLGNDRDRINPDEDMAVMPVTQVTVTIHGHAVALRAVGYCRYSNPYKPDAMVNCVGFTSQGASFVNFKSDGSPPKTMVVH